jgi:HPt (histidine-containing phosphotransfer) domain-containing protein
MSFNHKKHILDFQQAIKASAGNEQLAHKLLAVFISQLTSYQQNLKKDLDLNNNQGLQNSIHKLNGALKYIGAPFLSQKVSELDGQVENLAKDNLIKKVNDILDLLELINKEEEYQKQDNSTA